MHNVQRKVVASLVLATTLLCLAVRADGIAIPGFPGLPDSLPTMPKLPADPPPVMPKDKLPTSVSTPPKSASDAPDYKDTNHIFSLNDQRLDQAVTGHPPFLEVIKKDALKTYQKNRSDCQVQATKGQPVNATQCPQFEWSVPFSLEGESIEAAKGLRKAWQRFEDRYYWRVLTSLNNPSFYVAFCMIDLATGLSPSQPDSVSLTVPRAVLPKGKDFGSLPQHDPGMYLDDYIPLPKVKNGDYCDGQQPAILPLMYVPGFCLYVMNAKIICTDDLFPPGEDGKATTGTSPLWFNSDEATHRVTDAIEHAQTQYLAEYQSDALQEIAPGKRNYFFPLPWASNVPGDGAVIAPIMNANPDPSAFLGLGGEARARVGGLEGVTAELYYFQNVIGRSSLLNLHQLPGRTDISPDVPGVWKLEELKRFLPPSNLSFYEQFGYVNFFEAWNENIATVLPENNLAKLLRPIVFYAVGVDIYIDLTGIRVGGNIAPIPVAPFLTPFAGPRMTYAWTSVPEGYEIPNVKNKPLFDYRNLLRTTR